MHISWYGLSTFKITTKEATVFTDPFSKTSGQTPPRGAADIAILSAADQELYSHTDSISGEPFIISGPGEYDIKGVFIHGIPVGTPSSNESGNKRAGRTTIYTIASEGVVLGFLGVLNQKSLTEQQIEELNDVDVLIVPIGGGNALDAEAAVALVNQIEPAVVIPMHYRTPGLSVKLDPLDRFLKEMGSKGEELDKLVIKKTDIDEERTRLVILTPARG